MKQNPNPSAGRPRSLLASGLSLSALTLLSRVLGLLREMTKAKFLGTESYADAFGIAFMIPNLFRRLFAENSISVAFIPTFRAYLEDAGSEAGRKEAAQFVNATFTLVTFAAALVVTAGIAAAPAIAPLFYKDAQAAALAETALLTRIMFPYLLVISIAAFFQGILNTLKIFAPSGFTPVLFNAIVVAATYILKSHVANPARAMAVGVIAGGTVQAAFQLPFVLRTGWRVGFTSLKKVAKNAGTRKVLLLIGPTIAGMAAYQLNDLVSTALAGKAGTGVVSSLQYSLRLQELILGVFVVTIGTVILPDLAGHARGGRWEQFNEVLSRAMRIIALLTVPISFFAFAAGREIISLVYKGNAFADESVRLTLEAFRFHILGLFFIAANRIISQAFYSTGNSKSPALAGILSFVVNMALAAVLAGPFRGGGIALALSAASLANTVILAAFLRKSPDINVGAIVRGSALYVAKLAVLSALCVIPVVILLPELGILFESCGRFVRFGVPLFAAAGIFAVLGTALLLLTKDKEATWLIRKMMKKA